MDGVSPKRDMKQIASPNHLVCGAFLFHLSFSFSERRLDWRGRGKETNQNKNFTIHPLRINHEFLSLFSWTFFIRWNSGNSPDQNIFYPMPILKVIKLWFVSCDVLLGFSEDNGEGNSRLWPLLPEKLQFQFVF